MVNGIWLVAVLWLGQTESKSSQFFERLADVDQTNPRVLLDLANRSLSDHYPAGARICFEMVLKRTSGQAPLPVEWCEASFGLAQLEIGSKRYENGYERLREILDKCQHEERKCCREDVRKFRQKAETDKTRKQLRLFNQGKEHFAKKKWEDAYKDFKSAYDLIPEELHDNAFIPRVAILTKLSECQAQLDVEFARARAKGERETERCRDCAGSSMPGFVTCRTCKGKGTIPDVVLLPSPRGGLVRKRVDTMCPTCGRLRFEGCPDCFGIGFRSEVMTEKERMPLKTVIARVKEPKVYNSTLRGALDEVEEVVLDVGDASALNYFRAIPEDERYGLSRELRTALPKVLPWDDSSLEDAERGWIPIEDPRKENFSEVTISKVNFLLSYACEYSVYINKFDMLRAGGAKKLDFRGAAPESLLAADPLNPEFLSAFPDEKPSEWITVKGIFLGFERGGTKGRLTIEGEHHVEFFVWLKAAKPHLERLGKERSKRYHLSGLAESYPFEIGERILQSQAEMEDHVVLLVGRFLRNRLGYPRNCFEVWQFEKSFSRKQTQLLDDLSEPVEEISFSDDDDISVARFARFLGDWRGLRIRFEGVSDETLIQCEARRQCPLGLLIDELARSALKSDWYYDGGTVVFCRSAPSARVIDRDVVLAELNRRNLGEAKVSVVNGSSARGTAALPQDAAGLRVVLSDSMETMAYDVAIDCLEKLRARTPDARSRSAMDRLKTKLQLFHMLTRRTPVSHLVDAPELTEITYRKWSGEPVKALVRVLNESPKTWKVQEAYGIRFSLDTARITPASKTVRTADWRAAKELKLKELEEQLERAPPDAKPSRLFLLAILAKTHGMRGKGTAYLKSAIATAGFDAFLKLHSPDDFAGLVALWKQVVSPDASTPEVATQTGTEVETVEVNVPAQSPEPLADGAPPEELLAHAREYMRLGAACYRKMLEGEDASRWLQRARDYLGEAKKEVQRYLEVRSNDPTGVTLERDIRQMERDLVKDMGFFD
jgi:hypothetical protein